MIKGFDGLCDVFMSGGLSMSVRENEALKGSSEKTSLKHKIYRA